MQSEGIYNAFTTVYEGEKDLLVSMDRYGIMRPTKKVPVDKAHRYIHIFNGEKQYVTESGSSSLASSSRSNRRY